MTISGLGFVANFAAHLFEKENPMSKESSEHAASIAGRALRGERITASETRTLAASVLVQHETEKATRRPKRRKASKPRAPRRAAKAPKAK